MLISNQERLVGERLKHYRVEQNLTQVELAEQAGIARRTLTSLENGNGCTLSTLLRVLNALERTDLLEPLFAEPPIDPNRLHEIAMLRAPEFKYASKKRRTRPPKGPFQWGDEKANPPQEP